ncbi:YcxB family protein [Hirschia maritima]|uniref:YcxB family protein n=1 Tax=Hirschia maritima TaxID=1121961 RepID=UPI000374B09E|nr:YcxB family protein [Hirschia maritima]
MPETELPYRPEHATGEDLAYKDNLSVSGYLSAKRLKKFINSRRHGGFGPTTIYYAGLVAPVISASAMNMFETFFNQQNLPPQTAYILSLICAAIAGLFWFLTFSRLAQRDKAERKSETTEQTHYRIDNSGIFVQRASVETKIGWPSIVDIRTTKHYIAFIVKGANDFFIPVDWFESHQNMLDAANKISALRPPPFSTEA